MNWRVLTVGERVRHRWRLRAELAGLGVQALYVVWALIGFRLHRDLPGQVSRRTCPTRCAYGVRRGWELSVTAAVLFGLPAAGDRGAEVPRRGAGPAGVIAGASSRPSGAAPSAGGRRRCAGTEK